MKQSTVIAVTFCSVLCQPLRAAVDDMSRLIQSEIAELGDPKTSLRAHEALLELPPERVVPAVVTAIRTDPAFQSPAVRSLAYRVLLLSGSARFPEGLDQLLRGLRDDTEQIRIDAAYALGRTPTEQQPEVVRAFDATLRDAAESREVKKAVLVSLPKFRAVGEPSFEALRLLFTDADTDESLRTHVAYAMLAVGGLQRSLEWFRRPEYVKSRSVFWALSRYGTETNGSFDAEENVRKECRGIGLMTLTSDDPAFRKAGLQGIGGYFGDFACEKVGGQYRLNEALRSVLTQLEQKDDDAEIRAAANAMLTRYSEILRTKNATPGSGD